MTRSCVRKGVVRGERCWGRSSGYEYCSSCISESFSHGVLFFTGSGVQQGVRGGRAGGRAGRGGRARLRAPPLGVRRDAFFSATWVGKIGRVGSQGW